jgi:hypothetical protein
MLPGGGSSAFGRAREEGSFSGMNGPAAAEGPPCLWRCLLTMFSLCSHRLERVNPLGMQAAHDLARARDLVDDLPTRRRKPKAA